MISYTNIIYLQVSEIVKREINDARMLAIIITTGDTVIIMLGMQDHITISMCSGRYACS